MGRWIFGQARFSNIYYPNMKAIYEGSLFEGIRIKLSKGKCTCTKKNLRKCVNRSLTSVQLQVSQKPQIS